jgi:hypothetical protein
VKDVQSKQIHAFPSVTPDLVLFVQRHVKEPKDDNTPNVREMMHVHYLE